jgi:hypothetical protein
MTGPQRSQQSNIDSYLRLFKNERFDRMKKLSLVDVLSLTLAGAGLLVAARADDQIPLKGYLSVTAEPSSTQPDSPLLDVQITGTGQATVLGNVVVAAAGKLDPATLTYTGSFVWTASNGDTVYGEFVGQFIPTAQPGIFQNIEVFTITGGSGRFEDATGGGLAGGLGNPFQPNFLHPFTGTISSPGAGKN